jgi:thiamine kinase-like enzyme
MMVQIHKLKNRIEVALPVEDFNNNYREQLNRLKIQVQKADGHIRSIFEDNKTLIEGMIEKQESEAERYKHQKVDLVLTHGDITGRNIIQATRGLKLVDWDGAMFAPAEKDINFLYDNPNFSLEEYYKQMGKDKALFNPGLKEYYGRKWAIESILGNFETLLEGVPEENRQEYLDEINEYLGYYK